MMTVLRILGILWSAPLGIRALVLMALPWWKGTWFPYWPKKARRRGLRLHFVARRIIPEGFDRTGDGDVDDPEDFRTGAQTHWFMTWYYDENHWNYEPLVDHEDRHIDQELLFGPFYGLTYVGHFLINLARFRDAAKAYQEIIWERDARKHAGH